MYDRITCSDTAYTRRMDMIRFFYLLTYPISQPIMWWVSR